MINPPVSSPHSLLPQSFLNTRGEHITTSPFSRVSHLTDYPFTRQSPTNTVMSHNPYASLVAQW